MKENKGNKFIEAARTYLWQRWQCAYSNVYWLTFLLDCWHFIIQNIRVIIIHPKNYIIGNLNLQGLATTFYLHKKGSIPWMQFETYPIADYPRDVVLHLRRRYLLLHWPNKKEWYQEFDENTFSLFTFYIFYVSILRKLLNTAEIK